jgi:hypothetical protein
MPHFPKPFFRPSRGLWYIQIRGKQHNLGPCTAEEAVERAVALKNRLKVEDAVGDPTALVAVIDAFLEWVERNRAPKTYEWFHYRLQRFAERYPDLELAELRPWHVTQWADSYRFSVTSRRNYLRSVKRCMSWAAKQGYVTRSPIADLEVPAADRRERPVTPDVFRTLLNAAKRQ